MTSLKDGYQRNNNVQKYFHYAWVDKREIDIYYHTWVDNGECYTKFYGMYGENYKFF